MKRFATLNTLRGDVKVQVRAIEMLGYQKDSDRLSMFLNGEEHFFVYASSSLAEEAFKKLSDALEPNPTLDEQNTDTSTDTRTDTRGVKAVYDTMPFAASSALNDVTWYAFCNASLDALKAAKIRHHTYAGKVDGADGYTYYGWRRDD